jgi:hypothetical protein
LEEECGCTFLGRANGNHILGAARGTNGLRVRSGIAGGKNNDHLLVTCDSRLTIPHQHIVFLRFRIILATGVCAPTIAADARAIAVGIGLESGIVWEGVFVGIENDRRADLNKRANSQAVVIAKRISVRESRWLIVKAGDNVRIEVTMTVTALE